MNRRIYSVNIIDQAVLIIVLTVCLLAVAGFTWIAPHIVTQILVCVTDARINYRYYHGRCFTPRFPRCRSMYISILNALAATGVLQTPKLPELRVVWTPASSCAACTT